MGIGRTGRLAAMLAVSAIGLVVAAPASANLTDVVLINYGREIGPATGTPLSGFFSVVVPGNSVSSVVERAGVVIASASQPPCVAPAGMICGQATTDATLEPGDVIRVHDALLLPGSQDMATTFTGYPTMNPVSCGQRTVTGTLAPGQTLYFVTDGFSSWVPETHAKLTTSSTSYTATFAAPIPSGALVLIEAKEIEGSLVVDTQYAVRTGGTCPALRKPAARGKARRHAARHRGRYRKRRARR